MPRFSLARAATGLMATTALLFLLAGAPTTQALDAADAKNLTRIGYIYTYPIMLTYRQMYADVIAKGPPYNFNQFVIQDNLPDFKVRLCALPLSLHPSPFPPSLTYLFSCFLPFSPSFLSCPLFCLAKSLLSLSSTYPSLFLSYTPHTDGRP